MIGSFSTSGDWIRTDHLITMREIFFCMILSLTLTMNLVLTVRLEIQAHRILPIVSHMRCARSREFPKSVLHADTIIVCCRLANFERTSLSTHRRHEFWGSHEELDAGADCDKFVGSVEDNYPGKCNYRSIWMIDCRKFERSRHRQELEETHRSKSEDYEVYRGIQELP